MRILDYAEPLIAMRQELKHLENAILHGKLEKVPQILQNIEIEKDRMEHWYWKQKHIDKQAVKA